MHRLANGRVVRERRTGPSSAQELGLRRSLLDRRSHGGNHFSVLGLRVHPSSKLQLLARHLTRGSSYSLASFWAQSIFGLPGHSVNYRGTLDRNRRDGKESISGNSLSEAGRQNPMALEDSYG